jgi:DNA-binding response OmpR family regulator
MAKLLLIEDDPFLFSLLNNRLQKEGFEVTAVKDGKEALRFLTEEKLRPDVILLDIILPGKTGFEILEEVRNIPELKTTKAIIFSNLGQEVDVQRGKELGAEYLVKARTSLQDIVDKAKELSTTKP